MDQIDMTRSEILLIDIERVFFPEKNKEKHQGHEPFSLDR
jgi:hypothetical protein